MTIYTLILLTFTSSELKNTRESKILLKRGKHMEFRSPVEYLTCVLAQVVLTTFSISLRLDETNQKKNNMNHP